MKAKDHRATAIVSYIFAVHMIAHLRGWVGLLRFSLIDVETSDATAPAVIYRRS